MRRLVNAWALLLLLIVSPRGGSIARAASLEHPTKHQLDEVAHLIGKHYFRKIAHDSLEAAALECLAGTLDLVALSALVDDHDGARIEQAVGHFDRRLEQAARIVPQIEHERPGADPPDGLERAIEFLRRAPREVLDADEGHA